MNDTEQQAAAFREMCKDDALIAGLTMLAEVARQNDIADLWRLPVETHLLQLRLAAKQMEGR